MKKSNLVTQNLQTKVFVKIGLEIHVTLSSSEKIFNFNKNLKADEKTSNLVEAWELGYLGTLPVLNHEVINLALKACIFLNAEISRNLTFDRKIYNYFDLSKGFQITQQNNPIGKNGSFSFLMGDEIVTTPISRIQLEEDTAKTSYGQTEITLDFNRAGNPLIEVVTDPVFEDISTVTSFVKNFQSALNYTGISRARMERGEFRVDLNFSFSFDEKYKTPRYEIKNLNSVKNIRLSFDNELQKHLFIYDSRTREVCTLESETLGFNEATNQTFVQREKTNYFYLPESNLPIIKFSENEINNLAKEMPIDLFLIREKLRNSHESTYLNLLFEKPLFAKIVNSLEKNKINYLDSFNYFASFFLNHVLAILHNYEEEKVLIFVDKKSGQLWELFFFFEEKKIGKEMINNLINSLLAENIYCSDSQWKELLTKESQQEQKTFVIDIEKEIMLILEEKQVNKRLISQPDRFTSFLLGILKKKFPSSKFDYQIILEVANKISTSST